MPLDLLSFRPLITKLGQPQPTACTYNMPREPKNSTCHSDRKPYARSYRPSTMRLEQPPSRTPSPINFVSSMRKEYIPASSDSSDSEESPRPSRQPQREPVSVTPERVPGGSTDPPVSAPAALTEPQLKLQAPPDRKFEHFVGKKIKQPKGGIGKPSAGGYSLQAVLETHGWSNDQYEDVLKEVRTLTVLHLDTTKTFHNQDPLAVANFLRAVTTRYPGFEYYEKEWPARDLAYQYLRNRKKDRNVG
ncbi:hypothetical protein PENSPDRAFT_307326 [Peniophora sp. CONT]|nr:hypothetical protein PENSPDRAFT_307326 [Peniophora sp. CONT]